MIMKIEEEYDVCKMIGAGANEFCMVFSDREVALYYYSPDDGCIVNKKFSFKDKEVFHKVKDVIDKMSSSSSPKYEIHVLGEDKKPVYLMPVDNNGHEGNYGVDVRLGENGEIETRLINIKFMDAEVNNIDKNKGEPLYEYNVYSPDFKNKGAKEEIQTRQAGIPDKLFEREL